jgi:hypothetical protein
MFWILLWLSLMHFAAGVALLALQLIYCGRQPNPNGPDAWFLTWWVVVPALVGLCSWGWLAAIRRNKACD